MVFIGELPEYEVKRRAKGLKEARANWGKSLEAVIECYGSLTIESISDGYLLVLGGKKAYAKDWGEVVNQINAVIRVKED